MNKVIGLIGGISPESTVRYYEYCFRSIRSILSGHNSGNIVVYSVNFEEIVCALEEGNWKKIDRLIQAAHNRLKDAGADFVAICSNTIHKSYVDNANLFDLPAVDIFSPIVNVIKHNHYKRVALLGTRFTVLDGFYHRGLKHSAIDLIIPENKDIEILNDLIFSHLTKGDFKNSLEPIIMICDKLIKQKKVDAIILGCTELPISFESISLTVPVIDSMRLHCNAIVNYALGLP